MRTVITWAILIAGFLFTYRQAYLIIANDWERLGDSDNFERAANAGIAMIAALLWPVTLLAWVVWRIATPKTAAQRREQLHTLEDRKRELERQATDAEARLYAAEKALGIRMPPIPPREQP